MEEDKNKDSFNFDLLKDLSIADLKAAMEYFYDEYKVWNDEEYFRKNAIKYHKEAISFNKIELDKLHKRKSLKGVTIMQVVFTASGFDIERKIYSVNTKARIEIKSKLKQLIDEYLEDVNFSINGGEDGVESLSEVEQSAEYFLDKYYLLKHELAERFFVIDKIKKQRRSSIESIVDKNILKYNNSAKGDKKKLVVALANEYGYEPESLRQGFYLKNKELKKSKFL